MRKPVTRMKRHNDIRKNYFIYLQIGLLASLSIFLIAFKVNLESEEPEPVVLDQQEEVEIEEVIQTKQIETPPPPPRPPVPVEVPNDEVIEDEILDLDAELDLDGPLDLPPPPPSQDEDEEEQIFVVVEQQPELIGGLQQLQASVDYPELARQAGIEGRVVVSFVVNKQGEVENPKVVRGIGGRCDEEALEAVKNAKFKPARQRGRPVKVRYSLPVTFRLSS